MSQPELLKRVVQALDAAGIDYMVTGSIVSSLQGEPRATHDIDIVIARELTKIHEEIRREKISESLAHFNKVIPKGEFVILFHT